MDIDKRVLFEIVLEDRHNLGLKERAQKGDAQAVADEFNAPRPELEYRVPIESFSGADLLIQMYQEFAELSLMLDNIERVPEEHRSALLSLKPLLQLLVHNAAVVVPVRSIRPFIEPLATIPGPTGEPILRPRYLADEDGNVELRDVEWQLIHLTTRRGSIAEAKWGRKVESAEVSAALQEVR